MQVNCGYVYPLFFESLQPELVSNNAKKEG